MQPGRMPLNSAAEVNSDVVSLKQPFACIDLDSLKRIDQSEIKA